MTSLPNAATRPSTSSVLADSTIQTNSSDFPIPERFTTQPTAGTGPFKGRRRRGSIGGPTSSLPPQHPSKIGPQRTSKVSQKLKILPSFEDQEEESGRDVYSQGTAQSSETMRGAGRNRGLPFPPIVIQNRILYFLVASSWLWLSSW